MYGWRPYVPVAKRRAAAARAMTKMGGASPVRIEGRTIASSFWGKSWCEAMESYGDYTNRLPRGRTYVRNGSVVDLKVNAGSVVARVSGSQLYSTTITVKPLAPARWKSLVDAHAGQVASLVDLLQGKLPASLLRALADRSSGLFPGPKEISFACSCPDWADMCKHVAAVLYGVGARLDDDPGLFFTLRGVDVGDLVTRSSSVSFLAEPGDLDGDLEDLFGIELDALAPPATKTAQPTPAAVSPVPPKPAAPKPGAPKRAAAKPAASKPAARRAPKAALVQRATLSAMGVSDPLIAEWLDAGVLEPTENAAAFRSTPQTSTTITGWLVARAKTR